MTPRRPPVRGLTLIEMLLALALMSSLLVLSGEWIQTALEREAATATSRDRAAIDQALDRIEDLLRSGDWPVEARPATERISATRSGLTIRSRVLGHGSADATVAFDRGSNELTLRVSGQERVLASGLEDVQIEVREIRGDDRLVVSFRLASGDGHVVHREFLVR